MLAGMGAAGLWRGWLCPALLALTGLVSPPACLPGRYGAGCAQRCRCPPGRPCHHLTGACGCPPGFAGHGCEKSKFVITTVILPLPVR